MTKKIKKDLRSGSLIGSPRDEAGFSNPVDLKIGSHHGSPLGSLGSLNSDKEFEIISTTSDLNIHPHSLQNSSTSLTKGSENRDYYNLNILPNYSKIETKFMRLESAMGSAWGSVGLENDTMLQNSTSSSSLKDVVSWKVEKRKTPQIEENEAIAKTEKRKTTQNEENEAITQHKHQKSTAKTELPPLTVDIKVRSADSLGSSSSSKPVMERKGRFDWISILPDSYISDSAHHHKDHHQNHSNSSLLSTSLSGLQDESKSLFGKKSYTITVDKPASHSSRDVKNEHVSHKGTKAESLKLSVVTMKGSPDPSLLDPDQEFLKEDQSFLEEEKKAENISPSVPLAPNSHTRNLRIEEFISKEEKKNENASAGHLIATSFTRNLRIEEFMTKEPIIPSDREKDANDNDFDDSFDENLKASTTQDESFDKASKSFLSIFKSKHKSHSIPSAIPPMQEEKEKDAKLLHQSVSGSSLSSSSTMAKWFKTKADSDAFFNKIIKLQERLLEDLQNIESDEAYVTADPELKRLYSYSFGQRDHSYCFSTHIKPLLLDYLERSGQNDLIVEMLMKKLGYSSSDSSRDREFLIRLINPVYGNKHRLPHHFHNSHFLISKHKKIQTCLEILKKVEAELEEHLKNGEEKGKEKEINNNEIQKKKSNFSESRD